jgi:hypothetical protein
MEMAQSQNYSVPLSSLLAKPRRNEPGHSRKVSLVMEVEQKHLIKYFMEEGMKAVEIIDWPNRHYG